VTPPPAARLARGHETILLVEDDEFVRELERQVLEAAGYRVLAAQDPNDAERRFEEVRGQVDLLVTDVVMPDETAGSSPMSCRQSVLSSRSSTSLAMRTTPSCTQACSILASTSWRNRARQMR